MRIGSKKAWTRTVGGRYAANQLHHYLRALWNWAILKGYVDTTPFTRVGRPTMQNPPRRGAASPVGGR